MTVVRPEEAKPGPYNSSVRLAWLEGLLAEKRITSFARDVAVAIAASINSWTGIAKTSSSFLAQRTACTQKGAQNAVQALLDSGHLELVKKGAGSRAHWLAMKVDGKALYERRFVEQLVTAVPRADTNGGSCYPDASRTAVPLSTNGRSAGYERPFPQTMYTMNYHGDDLPPGYEQFKDDDFVLESSPDFDARTKACKRNYVLTHPKTGQKGNFCPPIQPSQSPAASSEFEGHMRKAVR